MLDIREERMSDAMLKIHIPGLGVLHHFTAPDMGAPHDHPWNFTSMILKGGYIEEVYRPDGACERIHRKVGDHFAILAGHIHRIVELPEGECWTCIDVLGPKVQEPGFYEWREGRMFQRRWNEPEFRPVG